MSRLAAMAARECAYAISATEAIVLTLYLLRGRRFGPGRRAAVRLSSPARNRPEEIKRLCAAGQTMDDPGPQVRMSTERRSCGTSQPPVLGQLLKPGGVL